MRFDKLILTVLILITGLSQAQETCDITISGSVLDEHNQEPLAFAFIVIEGTSNATTSDSLGNYILKGVCPGKLIVHCDHMGCERIIDTLNTIQSTIHNFHPEHHVNELGLLEITTHVKKSENKQTKLLNEQEIVKTQTKQLGAALSQIQGVQNQSSGNNVSKPSIHGMHSNRVLILNNELRQEGQQWGTDHGVELDFTNSGSVQVISGANSLAYGSDAIGGVIIVNPKPLRKKHGLQGSIFLGGESNGKKGVSAAELNGNFKAIPQLSYRLQGSLKKSGNINAPDYYIDNTGLEEHNYSWALGYRSNNYGLEVSYADFNSNIGVFSGAHIGNLTDLQAAFTAEVPNTVNQFSYDIARPYQTVSHETVKAKSFFYFNDTSKLEIIYGRQFNQRSEFDNHSAGNVPDFNFNLTSHTAEVKYSFRGKFSHQTGIQSGYQTNTWDGRFFIPNYEKYTAGTYFIETYKNGHHLINIGGRYDYNFISVYYFENDVLLNPIHNYSNANGSISYAYNFSDSLIFRSNIGSAWRPPSINELYSNGLHHGSASLEYGAQNLNSEQVYNLNTSLEKKWKKVEISTQLYANYFENYIYLAPTGESELTIRGAFPVYQFEQIKAWLNGWDFEADIHLTKDFDFEFGTSILRAKNQTDNEFLWGMPSDEVKASLSYSPNIGKHFKKTNFRLNSTHTTKQQRFHSNADFVNPPSAYTLLNFEAYTVLNIKTPLTFYFNINNLLNNAYRDYLNRFRYFTDEMGRNFVFGVKFNFEVEEKHHHHK